MAESKPPSFFARVFGWVRGAVAAVARSGAAAETWKYIGPVVLGMIGAAGTALVGIAQQAPGLAIAVGSAVVFAAVVFTAERAQAFLTRRRATRLEPPGPEPASLPGPPWQDASGRQFDMGDYSGPPDPEGMEPIIDALTNGVNARIGSRPLPPEVAAIVEAKQRNLTEIITKKLARGKWLPLDEAVRYLAHKSQWGLENNHDDPNFSVNLSAQLQDALACGDLTARGRKFHVLRGGVKDPPLYPLRPLGRAFWAKARIQAYWPLAGTARNIAGRRVENVVRKGDHEGMHDVLANQHQLEALWPPRQQAEKGAGEAELAASHAPQSTEEHPLQAAVKAKAQLMRDRLSTRNHIRSDPRYDSPRDISYLAAMWDAEERGHFYDEYHRSTFMPMGKGAPKNLPGDTIAELQSNVIEYKEKRRQANPEGIMRQEAEAKKAEEERAARLYSEGMARERSALKVKSDLMQQRLYARGLTIAGKDDSYFAAMWDAEQNGRIYDAAHKRSLDKIRGEE